MHDVSRGLQIRMVSFSSAIQDMIWIFFIKILFTIENLLFNFLGLLVCLAVMLWNSPKSAFPFYYSRKVDFFYEDSVFFPMSTLQLIMSDCLSII